MKRHAFKHCGISGLILLLVLAPLLCCCFTGQATAAPAPAAAMTDHSAHCGGDQTTVDASAQDTSGCDCPHLFAAETAVKAVTADFLSFRSFDLPALPAIFEMSAFVGAKVSENSHGPSPQFSSPPLFIRHHSLRI